MSSDQLNQVTMIIRSVNERTEQLCKKLIADQGVDEKSIFIVNEVPFSASMRKSFQLGLKQQKKWTYCVDADVLLRPGSVNKMIEFANRQNQNVCQVQGYMMDKFFGGVRKGGVHVYRTALLNKVLNKIPDEGKSIRPESYMLKQMDRDGYSTAVVPYIVGTHDDEQFNYDIYRKAFVQGVKHLDRAELLVQTWRENCEGDPDFKVALKGFSDSIANTKSTYINSELNLYKEKFKESEFEEKPPLNIDKITLDKIEHTIVGWEYSELYHYYMPDRDGLDKKHSAAMSKVKRNIKKNGFLKTGKLIISEILLSLGNKVRQGS